MTNKEKYKHSKYLLVYLVPYIYFAMWRDITCKIVWPYIAVSIWLVILRICLGRKCRQFTAVAGLFVTIVTTVISVLLFQAANLDKWSAYFGSFFPYPLILIIPIAEIFIYEIKKLK